MLSDLIDFNNYLLVNKTALKTLGPELAIYTSVISNIINQALKTKDAEIVNESFVRLDREKIEESTGISIEDQLKSDLLLVKLGIITTNDISPNLISFNFQQYLSIIASDDVKLLDAAKAKAAIGKPKGLNTSKTKYMMDATINSIECKDPQIFLALKDFVISLFDNGKFFSKQQVKIFTETLFKYSSNPDVQKEIIKLATARSWMDCTWSIQEYEKQKNATRPKVASSTWNSNTDQRRTIAVSRESL